MFQLVLPFSLNVFNVARFILQSLVILPLSEIGLMWLQDNHRRYRLAHGHVVTPRTTGLGILGLHSTYDRSSLCSKVSVVLCTIISIGLALLMEYGVGVENVHVMRSMNTSKGLTFVEWTSGKHFGGIPKSKLEEGFELDPVAGLQAKEICGENNMTPKLSNPLKGDYIVRCFQENTTHPLDMDSLRHTPMLDELYSAEENKDQPLNNEFSSNASVHILQRFDAPYFGFKESGFLANITSNFKDKSYIMSGACKAKGTGFCIIHNGFTIRMLFISNSEMDCSKGPEYSTGPIWSNSSHIRYTPMMIVFLDSPMNLTNEEMGLLCIRYSRVLDGLIGNCSRSIRRSYLSRADLARIGLEMPDILRNGKIYSEGLTTRGSYRSYTIQRPSINLFFIIPLGMWMVFAFVLLSTGLMLRWFTRIETGGQRIQYRTSTRYLLSLLGSSFMEDSNNISLTDWNVGIIASEDVKERRVVISKSPIETARVNKYPIV